MAMQKKENHEWLPVNQNNPCGAFDFNEEKWKG
jgi:hypothetical protein